MTTEPAQTHVDTVTAIHAWLRQRAADTTDGPGQWSNPDIRARLAHIIRTVRVRSHRIGVITASTEPTTDGTTWHYIAHDALHAAADRMHLRDYHIEPVDGINTYRLTWH